MNDFLCPSCFGRGFIASGEYPSETRRTCSGCRGDGRDRTGKSKFTLRPPPPKVQAHTGRRRRSETAPGAPQRHYTY